MVETILMSTFNDNEGTFPFESKRSGFAYHEIKRKARIRAGLTPTLTRKEEKVSKADAEEFWKNVGYWDHHPDKDSSRISDDSVKIKIKSHADCDKILKKYKLLINRSKKHIILLQYPNREPGQSYSDETGQKPLELRIKPKCGLVEVDIPMNVAQNFDKEKGLQFGAALRKSKLLQKGGSYGMAGGLGIGPINTGRNENLVDASDGPSFEKLVENFDDSNNKGYVMNKITLGGRIIPFRDGDPIYMIATFNGDICTFTKLDAMVQLRPQFSHLDALHEQDKSVARYDRMAEEQGERSKAEDVNMVVKPTDTNEDLDMYGGMADTAKLLRAMRDEPWQRLKWIDEEDPRSYRAYDENLVYQDPENAPQLISEMTNEQYLDAISCPRIDPTNQGAKVMTRPGAEDDFSSEEEEVNANQTERDEDTAITDIEKDDRIAKAAQIEEEAEEAAVELSENSASMKKGTAITGTQANQATGEDESAAAKWSNHRAAQETDNLKKCGTPPSGILAPNIRGMVRVENICRLVAIEPPGDKRKACEIDWASKIARDPEYAFLKPDHSVHKYYRWRLAENFAGRGIPIDQSAKTPMTRFIEKWSGKTFPDEVGSWVTK